MKRLKQLSYVTVFLIVTGCVKNDANNNSELGYSNTNTQTILYDGINREYLLYICLLYTSPSPRDEVLSRMPSSA